MADTDLPFDGLEPEDGPEDGKEVLCKTCRNSIGFCCCCWNCLRPEDKCDCCEVCGIPKDDCVCGEES